MIPYKSNEAIRGNALPTALVGSAIEVGILNLVNLSSAHFVSLLGIKVSDSPVESNGFQKHLICKMQLLHDKKYSYEQKMQKHPS